MATDFGSQARKSIEASIAVKQRLLNMPQIAADVARVSEILVRAIQNGNKPLLFGNGGSAADAQHIAAEFLGRFAFERAPLPALALSVNSSCVTAIGNDYGYEHTFSRQVQALGQPGDVAIGLSTSGKSENVARGILAAKEKSIYTVALTGAHGGKLKAIADCCICVPSEETPRIQECHILIGHIISELVEQTIFQ
jgi:D-sedoheptulose 7-phosphate isomerase